LWWLSSGRRAIGALVDRNMDEEAIVARMRRFLAASWVSAVGAAFVGAGPAGAANVSVLEGVDTIQPAVALASAGDTLVLQPGLYEISSTVLIDKNLVITGATRNVADVHVVAVEAEEFNFQEGVFLDPLDRGHIFFVTAGAQSVSFRYLTVKNAPETDISEGECTEGFGLNHSECFGDGIHTDGAGVVTVANVNASLNAGNGIFIDGATRAEFSDVVGVNNGAFGIDIDTALFFSVVRSTFTANQVSGIEASGHELGTLRSEYTADAVMDRVVANGNGEIGIEVERFETASVKNTTCAENREDGFDADRVSQVSISRSSFINNLDDAIEMFPVGVVPEEQPADFPGSTIVIFDKLTFTGNVGEDVNYAPTEN
jgi:hypothetical protein